MRVLKNAAIRSCARGFEWCFGTPRGGWRVWRSAARHGSPSGFEACALLFVERSSAETRRKENSRVWRLCGEDL